MQEGVLLGPCAVRLFEIRTHGLNILRVLRPGGRPHDVIACQMTLLIQEHLPRGGTKRLGEHVDCLGIVGIAADSGGARVELPPQRRGRVGQLGVAGVISGKCSVREMATKSPLVARHDYI